MSGARFRDPGLHICSSTTPMTPMAQTTDLVSRVDSGNSYGGRQEYVRGFARQIDHHVVAARQIDDLPVLLCLQTFRDRDEGRRRRRTPTGGEHVGTLANLRI